MEYVLVAAEDAMLVAVLAKEKTNGLGEGRRSLSASLTCDEKEVLGGGIDVL